MNRWVGVGHLAKDPEYEQTQSGVARCRFTIACQRRFTNAQGVREADFINCVAWRQTADFVWKYFKKGNRIAVEGSIQVRSYDAQDGSKRWVTEINVDNVEFAGSKKESGQHAPYGAPAAPPAPQPQQPMNEQQRMDFYQENGFTEVDDDELPF